MDIDLELSTDISIDHDRSVDDMFALGSDRSDSDTADVEESLFNLDSNFIPSRILNDFKDEGENNFSPNSDNQNGLSSDPSSASPTNSEEGCCIQRHQHTRTDPMTITLSSDDEFDSARDRPSTSRLTGRSRITHSKNARSMKALVEKRVKSPVPAKKKRKSPAIRQVQKSKRATTTAVSSAPIESPLNSREHDVDMEMVSNSIGDITLDRIQQLEADELLARELQSVYDVEDERRRRAAHRSRLSGFVPPRRANRLVRTATGSSPHVINQTRELINQSRNAYFPTETVDEDDDTSSPGTRRSARLSTNRVNDRRRDHFVGSLFLLGRQHEDAMSAILERHSQAMDALRNMGSRFNAYNVRHPVPADVAAFINWNSDDRVESFEDVLEMAERVGDANVGLKSTEITAFTTSKVYNASTCVENEKEVCSVCMCDYETGDALLILPCIHNFHKTCISKWLTNKPNCPICRIDVRS